MTIRTLIITLALANGTAFAEDTKKEEAKKEEAKPKESSGAAAEIKAGTGVEKHEIVGEGTTFAAGSTVWVWSRITNGQGTVKHVWKRDGKEVWTATLPVSSARWSTQTRRTIGAKGAWEVDVQSDAGASLGSVSFTIE